MRTTRLNLLRGVRLPLLTIEGEEDDAGAGAGAAPAAPPGEAGDAGGDPPPAEGGGAPPAGAESTPGAAGGEGGDPPPETPPAPKRVPWQNRRIDQLTAQAREAQERADRLEREANEARERAARYEALYGRDDAGGAGGAGAGGAGGAGASGGAGAAPAPRTTPTGERLYTQAEVEAEAARQANLRHLNDRCETMFVAGGKKHGKDWEARIQTAGAAFGADLAKRADFFDALTGLPNPEDVYYGLVGDLDHLADVLTLPPVKMGMELARLSALHGAPPQRQQRVSGAPAPLTMVEGGGGGAAQQEETTEQYAARREREIAARRGAQR